MKTEIRFLIVCYILLKTPLFLQKFLQSILCLCLVCVTIQELGSVKPSEAQNSGTSLVLKIKVS